jgi:hypothetical protein
MNFQILKNVPNFLKIVPYGTVWYGMVRIWYVFSNLKKVPLEHIYKRIITDFYISVKNSALENLEKTNRTEPTGSQTVPVGSLFWNLKKVLLK